MSRLLLSPEEKAFVREMVEEMRPQIELTAARAEIERLKNEVDLWKDRCMATEQAHDATVEHYEQLTNRDW